MPSLQKSDLFFSSIEPKAQQAQVSEQDQQRLEDIRKYLQLLPEMISEMMDTNKAETLKNSNILLANIKKYISGEKTLEDIDSTTAFIIKIINETTNFGSEEQIEFLSKTLRNGVTREQNRYLSLSTHSEKNQCARMQKYFFNLREHLSAQLQQINSYTSVINLQL